MYIYIHNIQYRYVYNVHTLYNILYIYAYICIICPCNCEIRVIWSFAFTNHFTNWTLGSARPTDHPSIHLACLAPRTPALHCTATAVTTRWPHRISEHWWAILTKPSGKRTITWFTNTQKSLPNVLLPAGIPFWPRHEMHRKQYVEPKTLQSPVPNGRGGPPKFYEVEQIPLYQLFGSFNPS